MFYYYYLIFGKSNFKLRSFWLKTHAELKRYLVCLYLYLRSLRLEFLVYLYRVSVWNALQFYLHQSQNAKFTAIFPFFCFDCKLHNSFLFSMSLLQNDKLAEYLLTEQHENFVIHHAKRTFCISGRQKLLWMMPFWPSISHCLL